MIGSLPFSLPPVFRLGLPAALAVVNVALLALWLGYLGPLAEDLEKQRTAFQIKAASLGSPLAKYTSELDQIERWLEGYEELQGRRFFQPQDRLDAARLFDELRRTYGLTGVSYALEPERMRADPRARKSGWGIISTRMKVGMRGLLDTDLFAFARAVVDRIPGQVKLESLSLTRLAKPTRKSIAALRDGQPVDLVSGGAVFEWRTLRPLSPEEMR